MNFLAAVAALFLATSTALPAFAAMPGPNSQRDAAATPIEAVQYRQTPQQRPEHAQTHRYRNGYDAYASHHRAPASDGAEQHRDVISGWPCTDRTESSEYSAFPSWEICN